MLETVLAKGIHEDEVGGAGSRRGRGRDVMVIIEGEWTRRAKSLKVSNCIQLEDM